MFKARVGEQEPVTITGSVRLESNLTVQPPQRGTAAHIGGESNQQVCFDLPAPFLATYSVQSNALPDRPIALFLASGTTMRVAVAGDSGSVVLPPDPGACITFRANYWECSLAFGGNPVCDAPGPGGPGPLTGSYSVTLTPQP